MRRIQIYLDERMDAQLRQGDDPIRSMAGSLRGLPADAASELDRDLYGGTSPRQ